MKFSLQKIAVEMALAALAMVIVPMQSEAVLHLTPDGILDGFTLTTFATINPGSGGFGPFGIAVASNGNIIVSNLANDTRYVWPDVDGQTVGSALFTVPGSGSGTVAYATAGGKPYGGVFGHFVQFKDNGTVDHILTGVTPAPNLGMWGNPVNGHIIATSSAGLIDIDPLDGGGAGSFRVIPGPASNGDGVSVSPDGKTAYVMQGSINGYDIASGALVFSSGFLFPSPDGTGVISGGKLDGFIIVNNNNGEIDLLDPSKKTFTKIAEGGTRGDYTSPDPFPGPNNGTLFLDYSDIIARLSCGPDCSIGGPPPTTAPEPGALSLSLFGVALVALGSLRRRKGA